MSIIWETRLFPRTEEEKMATEITLFEEQNESVTLGVALVAGLATGVPLVVLLSIYMVYCCCRRKHQGERRQEPRLWRQDERCSQDLFIPPFVPRIVQKFVQHSQQGTRNSSSATSTQTSPVEEKSFFSEDSGSYRTAHEDGGLAEKRHSCGSFEALNVPSVRRSSLLQLSTSSGDSSESLYEQRKGSDIKSPKNFPKDSKSFEFVRPIPVKPLITITRVESKDDMSTKALISDFDQYGQSHSDSQVLLAKKQQKTSRSLENVAVPSRSGSERRGSSDRNLGAGRRKGSISGKEGEASKQVTPAKIPVHIPSQVIHSRKDAKRRGSQGSPSLGRLNVSLQYKQTTCDLFVKILQARELPAKDLRNNTSSPYVRVYALPSRRHNHRTNVVEKSLHPVWNELFVITGLTLSEVRQLALHFLVIHHQPMSRNAVIGEVMLTLGGMEFTGDEVNLWRELRPHQFQNVLGELHLSVCHQPLSSKLSVTVLEARNLPKISSLNIGDPYVKVELFSTNRRVGKKKTRVKKKTVNPKFAQTFTFDLGGKLLLDHMTVMFTVVVQDSSGCHERVGQVVLSTAAGDGPEFDHWSQVICNPHCPIDQWHMIHE